MIIVPSTAGRWPLQLRCGRADLMLEQDQTDKIVTIFVRTDALEVFIAELLDVYAGWVADEDARKQGDPAPVPPRRRTSYAERVARRLKVAKGED